MTKAEYAQKIREALHRKDMDGWPNPDLEEADRWLKAARKEYPDIPAGLTYTRGGFKVIKNERIDTEPIEVRRNAQL